MIKQIRCVAYTSIPMSSSSFCREISLRHLAPRLMVCFYCWQNTWKKAAAAASNRMCSSDGIFEMWRRERERENGIANTLLILERCHLVSVCSFSSSVTHFQQNAPSSDSHFIISHWAPPPPQWMLMYCQKPI